jgi:hypothetical protein
VQTPRDVAAPGSAEMRRWAASLVGPEPGDPGGMPGADQGALPPGHRAAPAPALPDDLARLDAVLIRRDAELVAASPRGRHGAGPRTGRTVQRGGGRGARHHHHLPQYLPEVARPAREELRVDATMINQAESVVCCFCGKSLPIGQAVLLVAYPRHGEDETQNLYSHKACLRARLHPSVPVHPDLFEDEASDA